ncbi:class I SAM-dependent methyltransferase [Rheinheimera baltica]|nr:class I SAM-dependent methyltransferase [Rheinheimera baltica]
MPNHQCPLCYAEPCQFFYQDNRRRYYQCQLCLLVFADRTTLLSSLDELAQYQMHQNDLNDIGYRQFLQRLALPLQQQLAANGLEGLDFGCGPGPLLAKMLAETGHKMSVWDPYFATDDSVLKKQYDFITCSEAIEHFIYPVHEWKLWLTLLKPGGTLGIMTKRYTDVNAFASWHYKRDPTHVSFFCEHTFIYLAQRDNFIVNFPDKDIALLQRRKH